MKLIMKKICVLFVALVLSFLTACNQSDNINEVPTETMKFIKPYEDIRAVFEKEKVFEENEYNSDDIITFTFNEGTVLKGNEKLQDEIMSNGKNPGLGVRELHKEGITGKGINVAIIDQNLLLHHPEFDGKITEYYDTGCEQESNSGSMHAPAVTSILVGDTIGVAPDAKVYFAAAPSWKGDSEFYSKGLYWIIEENKKLPDGEKIRVVSVSAAPSGEGSPFTKNMVMWDDAVQAAQDEGILVLDCRADEQTGIISSAFYDTDNPDDVSMCTGGFPTSPFVIESSHIGVPTSYRTVAEEYSEGSPSYQYTGQGGLSWAIPYAAGVLALGWQINPTLDKDKIVQILFETCTIANDGSNIINPIAFIEAIEKTNDAK
jgi:subtilisin family serine protease